MTINDLKIMQMTNQYLINPSDKLKVISDLCGFQAQYFYNAYHASLIRCKNITSIDAWGENLIKSWTIRGTVHIHNETDIPLFIRHQMTADDVCRSEFYCKHGTNTSPDRNIYFANIIYNLIKQGIGKREELKIKCFEKGMTINEAYHIFSPWGGIIRELAEIGILCFIVKSKKEYRLCKTFVPIDEKSAHIEMARRYFTYYGPATLRDAAYFFGTAQKNIKIYLEFLPYETYVINNKSYYFIKNNNIYNKDIPRCIFLAGFDPMLLGYQKKESIYLPKEFLRNVFNLNGIVFPTILLDGQIIGKWKNETKKIICTLFKNLTSSEKSIINKYANEIWASKKVSFISS